MFTPPQMCVIRGRGQGRWCCPGGGWSGVEAEPEAWLLWPLADCPGEATAAPGDQRSLCKDCRGRSCQCESTQLYVCKQVASPVLLGEELKCTFSCTVKGWTAQKHHGTLDRCHPLDSQGSQAVLSAFGKLSLLFYSAESKFICSLSTLCAYIQWTCTCTPRSTTDCMWCLDFFFHFQVWIPSLIIFFLHNPIIF